jgi:hypothetical protein
MQVARVTAKQNTSLGAFKTSILQFAHPEEDSREVHGECAACIYSSIL